MQTFERGDVVMTQDTPAKPSGTFVVVLQKGDEVLAHVAERSAEHRYHLLSAKTLIRVRRA